MTWLTEPSRRKCKWPTLAYVQDSFLRPRRDIYSQINLLVAPPEADEQEELFKSKYHDTGHSGFQVLLSLQLIMKFCEAGHPNTHVRERGGQLMPKSEMISPWTEVLQTPGADVPLAHVGMFISHM